MIRIGFFGTPELSASVLSDILQNPLFEVCFVVSNPDKPFGREQIMKSSPVKSLAMKMEIPVFTPIKVKNNIEFLDTVSQFDCDYFIIVAYGKILPNSILEIPKKMCINIHGSILPQYRGASPIQAALLNGEKETGVTIMKMSEGMDEGDILKIQAIPIDPHETSLSLFEKFGKISGPILIQAIKELEHGGITPLPQKHELATYCKKIDKEDGQIDWNKKASDIYHIWQAYTPWPGTYTYYNKKRLLVENMTYDMDTINHGKPGQVMRLQDGNIGVFCGEGILTLEKVKLEGKKSQHIKDFINGNHDFIGYIF